MRIISGKYGGRIIKIPSGLNVRPMTDRVKEALFNYLANKLDFEGIKILDLYAGSGALGLECISRGAESADFVEMNNSVSKTLTENIISLNALAKCRIFKMDALRFLERREIGTYELILADPPFFKNDIHLVVKRILAKEILSANGMLIVERSIQSCGPDTEEFKREPFKRIGDALLYSF